MQDYTPNRKKKAEWDDKDLIQISSFKGRNEGSGKVSEFAPEKAPLAEFRAELLKDVSPGLPTYDYERVYTERRDFTAQDIDDDAYTFGLIILDDETKSGVYKKIIDITLIVKYGTTPFASDGGNVILNYDGPNGPTIGTISDRIFKEEHQNNSTKIFDMLINSSGDGFTNAWQVQTGPYKLYTTANISGGDCSLITLTRYLRLDPAEL